MNVADVEVDAHPSGLHAESLLDADFEDFAGADVAGDKVAILGVAFLEKIVALVFGDVVRVAGVLRLAGDPDATALAAGTFADQSQLVGAGDGRGMDLDELGIAIACAGLVDAADRGAVAGNGIGGAAVDGPAAAAGDHQGVGRK